jgi:D-alanyl-D-alanine carboxypeptidase/D-alanyl-D-alanine-endopeptidase (penicillin-binding protein 4)
MWSENGRPVLLPGSFGVKTTYLPSKAPPQVVYDPIRRTATVSGQLPPGKVLLDTLALPSPDLDAASLFSKTVRRTSIVPTTSPTFTIQGKPIREAIADCLKPSDNLIAENLLMMAASRQGPWLKTPYSDADDRLSTLLTKTVGIPSHSISPEDGSGLSRRNIVTAKTLVQVLNWQKNQPTAEIFRNALARPNEKGTLRTRLQGIQFEGKTGSLFMVSALSGYITSSNGRKATVSILLNHFTCTADEARALMDRIVRSLASKLEEPSDSARFTGLLQD